MWILRLEISSRKWRVEPQVDGWWHVTIGCNNLCVRGWNPRCLLPIKHVLLTTNTPFQALKGCHFSGFFGSCQVCIYGILLGIPPLWIPCWGHFNWVVLTMFVVDHYFPSLFIHPKVAVVLIVGWECWQVVINNDYSTKLYFRSTHPDVTSSSSSSRWHDCSRSHARSQDLNQVPHTSSAATNQLSF